MKVENELPSAKSVEMFLVRNGTFDPRNMNFPFNCKIQRKICWGKIAGKLSRDYFPSGNLSGTKFFWKFDLPRNEKSLQTNREKRTEPGEKAAYRGNQRCERGIRRHGSHRTSN